MEFISQLWRRLDRSGRIGLLVGLFSIVTVTAGLGYWALRTEKAVLFSGLAPSDARAMIAELDRMKLPYELADSGQTILMAAGDVHKTRLQLMGGDIPLHGGVGFELFNESDFGMTEFAQKVNYQRALQGEITRTILAIEDIQAARVHLVVPEQGLFKKPNNQAKASVTLTLKQGRTLQVEQVRGIQRLVAASVTDIKPEAVTVLDQNGVALTRSSDSRLVTGMSEESLERKRAFEDYIVRKLDSVLAASFGIDKPVASVDVLFTDAHFKQTTEDVVPGVDKRMGTIVRERKHSQPSASEQDGDHEEALVNTQAEVEYQLGRRVVQTEREPGGIERISVAVVVRQVMDESELIKLREIVSNAAGLRTERGDTIAVYPLIQLVQQAQIHTPTSPDRSAISALPSLPVSPAIMDTSWKYYWWILPVTIGAGLLVLSVGLIRRQSAKPLVHSSTELDDYERTRLLDQVRQWLQQDGMGGAS